MAENHRDGELMDDESSFLRTGDSFSLVFDDERSSSEQTRGSRACNRKFYLTGDGFGTDSCSIADVTVEEVPVGFYDCVFEFSRASSVRAVQAATQKSAGSASSRRSVLYGHAVQIQHVHSKKLLACSNVKSNNDSLDLNVGLINNDEVSRDCWFRVQPGSKQRSEGEKVRIGDEIYLVSMSTERYLYMSLENNNFPIGSACASFKKALWRLNPFCTVRGRRSELYLKGGDTIRLVQKFTDDYIAVLETQQPVSNTEMNELDNAGTHSYRVTTGSHGIPPLLFHSPRSGFSTLAAQNLSMAPTTPLGTPKDFRFPSFSNPSGVGLPLKDEKPSLTRGKTFPSMSTTLTNADNFPTPSRRSSQSVEVRTVYEAAKSSQSVLMQDQRLPEGNSFWRVELDHSRWGGAYVAWGEPFRLQSLTTGHYLCYKSETDNNPRGPIFTLAPMHDDSSLFILIQDPSGHKLKTDGHESDDEQPSATSTSFIQSMGTPAIEMSDSAVFVKMKRHQVWLHPQGIEHDQTSAAVEDGIPMRSTSPSESQSRDDSYTETDVSTSGSMRPQHELMQETHRCRPLLARNQPHMDDAFGLISVLEADVQDVHMMRICQTKLTAFAKQEIQDYKYMQTFLDRMLRYMKHVDTSSDRSAVYRRRRALFRQQNLIDRSVEILLHANNERSSTPAATKVNMDNTLFKLYQLLAWVLEDDRMNAVYLARAGYLNSLLSKLGGNEGLLVLLQAIVAHQEVSQLIYPSHVQSLIDLLNKNGRDWRILNILACLCESNGRTIRSTQNLVCEKLLRSPADHRILFKTQLVDSKETVRTNMCVGSHTSKGGDRTAWWFSCSLSDVDSTGRLRVGWASPSFQPAPLAGIGLGDDCHSFGFDGMYIWFGGSKLVKRVGEAPKLTTDMVVTCYVNFITCRLTFSVQGTEEDVTAHYPELARLGPLFPCISLVNHVSCTFDFGTPVECRTRIDPDIQLPQVYWPIANLQTTDLPLNLQLFLNSGSQVPPSNESAAAQVALRFKLMGPCNVSVSSNYVPKPVDTSQIGLNDFVSKMIKEIAPNIHEVWAANKMKAGYTYGPTRDDKNLKSPNLLPYHQLPESEQKFDCEMAEDILKVMSALQFRFSRPAGSPMPEPTQPAYVEPGSYVPRPVDISSTPLPPELLSLTDRLAEIAHDKWAEGRFKERWKFGYAMDQHAKCSPNLVPYKFLPPEEKKSNTDIVAQTLQYLVRSGVKITPPSDNDTRTKRNVFSYHLVDMEDRNMCTFCTPQAHAVRTGRWYYEVKLLTAGHMSFGWSPVISNPGRSIFGVDVPGAFLFDGYHVLKIGNNSTESFGKGWSLKQEGHPKPVLGCLIDLDTQRIRFTLNGRLLHSTATSHERDDTSTNAFSGFEIPASGFVPFISLSAEQECEIIFSREDMTYFDSFVLQEGYEAFAMASKKDLVMLYSSRAPSFVNLSHGQSSPTSPSAGTVGVPALITGDLGIGRTVTVTTEYRKSARELQFVVTEPNLDTFVGAQSSEAVTIRSNMGVSISPQTRHKYMYTFDILPGQVDSVIYCGWISNSFGSFQVGPNAEECFVVLASELLGSKRTMSSSFTIGCLLDLSHKDEKGRITFMLDGVPIASPPIVIERRAKGCSFFPVVSVQPTTSCFMKLCFCPVRPDQADWLPFINAFYPDWRMHEEYPSRLHLNFRVPAVWKHLSTPGRVNVQPIECHDGHIRIACTATFAGSDLIDFNAQSVSVTTLENGATTDLISFFGEESIRSLNNDVKFFCESLNLYAKVCSGNNALAQRLVRDLMDDDQLVYCISLNGLAAQIRTAFCHLLIALHVNSAILSRPFRQHFIFGPEIAKKEMPKMSTLVSRSARSVELMVVLKELVLQSIGQRLERSKNSVISELYEEEFCVCMLRLANALYIKGYFDQMYVRKLLELIDPSVFAAEVISAEKLHNFRFDGTRKTLLHQGEIGLVNLNLSGAVQLQICQFLESVTQYIQWTLLEAAVGRLKFFLKTSTQDRGADYLPHLSSQTSSSAFPVPTLPNSATSIHFASLNSSKPGHVSVLKSYEQLLEEIAKGTNSQYSRTVVDAVLQRCNDLLYEPLEEIHGKSMHRRSSSSSAPTLPLPTSDCWIDRNAPQISSFIRRLLLHWTDVHSQSPKLIAECQKLLYKQYHQIEEHERLLSCTHFVDNPSGVEDISSALQELSLLNDVRLDQQDCEKCCAILERLRVVSYNNLLSFSQTGRDTIAAVGAHSVVIACMRNVLLVGKNSAPDDGKPRELEEKIRELEDKILQSMRFLVTSSEHHALDPPLPIWLDAIAEVLARSQLKYEEVFGQHNSLEDPMIMSTAESMVSSQLSTEITIRQRRSKVKEIMEAVYAKSMNQKDKSPTKIVSLPVYKRWVILQDTIRALKAPKMGDLVRMDLTPLKTQLSWTACAHMVMQKCCEFLCQLCIRNSINQGVCFKYVGFLSQLIGRGFSVMSVVTEIIRNNEDLCLLLGEHQIEQFISRMHISVCQKRFEMQFLDFLKHCVVVNGQTLDVNASLVVKTLVKKQECLDLFSGKPEERYVEITRRIEVNETSRAKLSGRAGYHVALVGLLAWCGPNRRIRSSSDARSRDDTRNAYNVDKSGYTTDAAATLDILRSLLSKDDLVQVLCDDKHRLPGFVRQPFFLYLRNVYQRDIDGSLFMNLLQKSFFLDMLSLTTENVEGSDDQENHQYIYEDVLPFITTISCLSVLDQYPVKVDRLLHLCFELAKKASVKQLSAVTACVIALIKVVRPSVFVRFLRKCCDELLRCPPYTVMMLRSIHSYYDRNAAYFAHGGDRVHGVANVEEKQVAQSLFHRCYLLVQHGYRKESPQIVRNYRQDLVMALSAIACALSPDCVCYVNLEDPALLSELCQPINTATGYIPKAIDTSQVMLTEDQQNIVNRIAEHLHDTWASMRQAEGKVYAPVSDLANGKHSWLIPFAYLPPEGKRENIIAAEQSIKVVISLGFLLKKNDQRPGFGFSQLKPARKDLHSQVHIEESEPVDMQAIANNYRPHPVDLDKMPLLKEIAAVAERLAENAHEVWSQGKLAAGYTYGPVRIDQGPDKRHPQLLSYDLLSEEEQEYDRKMSQNTLKLIILQGYSIIPDERALMINDDAEKRFAFCILSVISHSIESVIPEPLSGRNSNASASAPAPRVNGLLSVPVASRARDRRVSHGTMQLKAEFVIDVVVSLLLKYFHWHLSYFARLTVKYVSKEERRIAGDVFTALIKFLEKNLVCADGAKRWIEQRALKTCSDCLGAIVDALTIHAVSDHFDSFSDYLKQICQHYSEVERRVPVDPLSSELSEKPRDYEAPLLSPTCRYVFSVILPIISAFCERWESELRREELSIESTLFGHIATLAGFNNPELAKTQNRLTCSQALSALAEALPLKTLDGFVDEYMKPGQLLDRLRDIVHDGCHLEDLNLEMKLLPLCSYLARRVGAVTVSKRPVFSKDAPHDDSEDSDLEPHTPKNRDEPIADQQKQQLQQYLHEMFECLMRLLASSKISNDQNRAEFISKCACRIVGGASCEYLSSGWVKQISANAVQVLDTVTKARMTGVEELSPAKYRKLQAAARLQLSELNLNLQVFAAHLKCHRIAWTKAVEHREESKEFTVLFESLARTFKQLHTDSAEENRCQYLKDTLRYMLPMYLKQFKHRQISNLMSHCTLLEDEQIAEKVNDLVRLGNTAALSFGSEFAGSVPATPVSSSVEAGNVVESPYYQTLHDRSQDDLSMVLNKSNLEKLVLILTVLKRLQISLGGESSPLSRLRWHHLHRFGRISILLRRHASLVRSEIDEQNKQYVILTSLTRALRSSLQSKFKMLGGTELMMDDVRFACDLGLLSRTQPAGAKPVQRSHDKRRIRELVGVFLLGAHHDTDAFDEALFLQHVEVMRRACDVVEIDDVVQNEDEGDEKKKNPEEDGDAAQNTRKDNILEEQQKQTLLARQNYLNDRGASQAIICLISSSRGQPSKILHKTLKFGISLLRGGNTEVQSTMLRVLNERRDVAFFAAMTDLVNKCPVLDYEKWCRKQRASRLNLEVDEVDDSTVESKDFALDIFRFLQLLCEGHNFQFQEYLRTQPGNTKTYNIVVSTADYLLRLQEKFSDVFWFHQSISSKLSTDHVVGRILLETLDVAEGVVRTLTEYIQGPSLGNQLALAGSRLWDALSGYLIIIADMQRHFYHSSKMPSRLLLKVCKLQSFIFTMLVSMLEGNRNAHQIAKRMIEALTDFAPSLIASLSFCMTHIRIHQLYEQQLFAVADLNKDRHITWDKYCSIITDNMTVPPSIRQKLDEFAALSVPLHYKNYATIYYHDVMEIAFQFLVLVENLTDIDPTDLRLSVFKRSDDYQALHQHFGKNIGRVEIVRGNGFSERIYFKIEDEWRQLYDNAQIKDSKNLFLHDMMLNQKKKFAVFVSYCVDTIFEMQQSERLFGSDSKGSDDMVALEQSAPVEDESVDELIESHPVHPQSASTASPNMDAAQDRLFFVSWLLILLQFCRSAVDIPFSVVSRRFSRASLSYNPSFGLLRTVAWLLAVLSHWAWLTCMITSCAINVVLLQYTVQGIERLGTLDADGGRLAFHAEGWSLFMLEWLEYLLPLVHATASLWLLLAFFFIKIPLTIFKREKEIAEELEDGKWIDIRRPQSLYEYVSFYVNRMAIGTRSFPFMYHDKFCKQRVLAKHSSFRREDRVYLYGVLGMPMSPTMDESGDTQADGSRLIEQDLISLSLSSVNTDANSEAPTKLTELLANIYEKVVQADWKYILWCGYTTLTCDGFLYQLIYFLVSLLGCIDPFFYCLHLLDVSYHNKTLQNVLKSVTMNFRQLILTLLLVAVTVYIYTVMAFNFFRPSYNICENPCETEATCTEVVHKCNSMWSCFIYHLSVGLRQGGGIGDVVSDMDATNPMLSYRILFDLSFFLFVIIVLLAIVQGIIIDSFGELRDIHNKVSVELATSCIVCGVSREVLDKDPHGFERHISQEHNVWNYLYFFMHLRHKPETEFTGQESFVHGQLAQRSYDFFPVGRGTVEETSASASTTHFHPEDAQDDHRHETSTTNPEPSPSLGLLQRRTSNLSLLTQRSRLQRNLSDTSMSQV